MPRPIPSLVVRAAVTATASAAVALAVLMPAASAEPPVAVSPTTASGTALPAAPVAAPVPTVIAPVRPVAVQVPAAVGRASAMRHALDKVGARYRWGAAGPNTFDCSGLVYWSYRQAGLALPRSSRAMSGVGAPVSRSALRPGDLVFFYRPVSHVAIYIGNGRVVHASTAGVPVKISTLDDMPFTAARRV